MAQEQARRVALMSIHPVHATSITEGRKLAEFRKHPVSRDVKLVLIYATKPIAAIVGAFRIVGQLTLSPDDIWQKYHDVGCIGKDGFFSYFLDRNRATAIIIGDVFRMDELATIQASLGMDRPPQSIQYIDSKRAYCLLEQMVQVRSEDVADAGRTNQLPIKV